MYLPLCAKSPDSIEPSTMRGIGFDATCSLPVFAQDTGKPIPVTQHDFSNDDNDGNVILWLDYRPVTETKRINAIGHPLLQFVGVK